MSRYAPCALLVLAAVPVAAVEVRSYDVTVQLAADGAAAVAVEVRLAGAAPGELVLPLGFAAADGLLLTAAPPGTTAAAAAHNGQALVRLGLPDGVPADLEVRLAFAARDVLRQPPARAGDATRSGPGGRRILRHALLNTRETTIARYRFAAALPAGLRAHAVREALPRPRAREVGPRARLGEVGGAPGVLLEVGELLQGETASVQVELVPRSLPVVWLLAGAVLSLLYLFRFRDLVARPRR